MWQGNLFLVKEIDSNVAHILLSPWRHIFLQCSDFPQHFLSSRSGMFPNKLESRAWSCSDLVRGAAQVVDMAAKPATVVLQQQREQISAQLAELSIEDLQKLLEEGPSRSFARSFFFVVVLSNVNMTCSSLSFLLEETEDAMHHHDLGDHAGGMAVALLSEFLPCHFSIQHAMSLCANCL